MRLHLTITTNYPDLLGTPILIKSIGVEQQLSVVGLWTVMAKTKDLTEDLWLLTSQERAIRLQCNALLL